MVLALISPVSFLLRRWKHRYPNEYIVVGKKGVSWRVLGKPEANIDWTSIENVSGSRFFDHVFLQQNGARRGVCVPQCLRPKSMEFDVFLELVKRSWENSRSQDTTVEKPH